MAPTSEDRKVLVQESVAAIKLLADRGHGEGAPIVQEMKRHIHDIDRIAGSEAVTERGWKVISAAEDVYVQSVLNPERYIEVRQARRAGLYGAIQDLENSLRRVGLFAPL